MCVCCLVFQPALSVPGAFAGKLPLGLELLSSAYSECALLRLAASIEHEMAQVGQSLRAQVTLGS